MKKSKRRVPAQFIPLLGTVSDSELARQSGFSRTTIQALRWRRGIKPFNRREPVRWTPETLSLLGKESDSKIAELVGLSSASVARMRSMLGIKISKKGRLCPRIWSPSMIAVLGTIPDEVVAARFGLGRNTVALKRRSLGINAYRIPAKPRKQWTRPMIDDLQLLPSAKVAEKYELRDQDVAAKRRELGIPSKFKGWEPKKFSPLMIGLLGKRPDKVLSRNFKMSVWMIRNRRNSLCIPAFKSLNSPWTSEVLAMLGKVSDMKIARKIGLAAPSVLMKRRKLGIPPAPYRKPVKWTYKMVQLLSTMPDSAIAKKLGIGQTTVIRKR